MSTLIKACLGILIRDNRILITSRPEGKVMAGYWEFPGGKIELGETYKQALARELHEELGIHSEINALHHLGVVEHQYPHGLAQLDVVLVTNWSGQISSCEKQSLHWHTLNHEVMVSPLLPTTVAVLNLLTTYLANLDQ